MRGRVRTIRIHSEGRMLHEGNFRNLQLHHVVSNYVKIEFISATEVSVLTIESPASRDKQPIPFWTAVEIFFRRRYRKLTDALTYGYRKG